MTRVLNWGKRKGFLPESCKESTPGVVGNCTDNEDYNENPCRKNNTLYRVVDYCIAQEELGIKKEILLNGPVIAQMTVYTDFLTYKSGIYHRTEDSFKFNGQLIVKILGWESGEGG